MPELPEVETIMRGLAKRIINKPIASVSISNKKLRLPYPKGLIQTLTNKRFSSIKRRSKYLLLELPGEYILAIHLGMSGRLYLGDPKTAIDKHEHLTIVFNSGEALRYNDPRRFGLIALCEKESLETHPLFKNLGVEPLSKAFNYDYLYKCLQRRRKPIKNLIMDANIIVGVGNIYACESLYRSRIHPLTPSNQLTSQQIHSLINSIQVVLEEAISSGGTTLKDYIQADGSLGNFQNKFQVYSRYGETCFECGHNIGKIIQQNRSTFYCPNCQKL